jgi:hypothetical protein
MEPPDGATEAARGEEAMMTYMLEGGMNMWVLLVVALATVAVAASRPRKDRPGVLFAGVVALLISGMFGLATGLAAVSAHYGQFPDAERVKAIGTGLGELSNNGSFAAILATALGVAGLVMNRRAAKES